MQRLFHILLLSVLAALINPILAQPWEAEQQKQLIEIAESGKEGSTTAATKKEGTNKLESSSKGQEGFFYVLLALMIIIALMRQLDPKRFKTIWSSYFNQNASFRFFKNKDKRVTWLALLLDFNFFVVASIFCYKLLVFLGWTFGYHPMVQIWIILFLLATFYFLKLFLLGVFNAVFRLGEVIPYYSFEIFQTNRVAGLVLLPLLIVLIFAPDFVTQPLWYLALLVLGVLLIYRTIKVLSLSLPLIFA